MISSKEFGLDSIMDVAWQSSWILQLFKRLLRNYELGTIAIKHADNQEKQTKIVDDIPIGTVVFVGITRHQELMPPWNGPFKVYGTSRDDNCILDLGLEGV